MCRRCLAVRTGAAARPLPPVRRVTPADFEQPVKLDPVAELHQLAADALAAYRADTSNAMLLRECRATLALLMPKDAGKADADLTGLLKALG